MQASGSITRSTELCEMSRSCQSATFSRAGTIAARIIRASPVRFSESTGLRLCGMAELPFCPTANGSSASPTSLRCRWRISVASRSIADASSARAAVNAACRSRGITWVETGSGRSPNRSATMVSTLRVDIGEGADRPGHGAGHDLVAALDHAPAAAGELGEVAGELEAEAGGLGVDAVAAADGGRALVLEGAPLQGFQQRVDLDQDQVRRALELDRQRGVEQVRGGQPEMQEPGLRAADLLDMGEKGDDVVAGDGLDLLDPGGVDQPGAVGGDGGTQGAHRFGRDGADRGHGLGGGELDVEPDAEPGLGCEDRRHLGAAVARDHAVLTGG